MKIGFLVDSISRRSGGLYEANRQLAKQLESQSTQVQVFGVRDSHTEMDLKGWNGVSVTVAQGLGWRRFGYSRDLAGLIDASMPDVLHSHGLWTYSSHVSLQWHRRSMRPLVIHPHGMLDFWAVGHASLKKRVAGWMFEYRHLKQASCIRALCEAEAQAIRGFGLRNPVAIIPNGIHLPREESLAPSASTSEVNEEVLPGDGGKRTLLYLGRIHPKKGLENVLNVWTVNRWHDQDLRCSKDTVQQGDWRFVIAGWDELSHENALKRCASARGIPWVDLRDKPSKSDLSAASVVFAGPQFGKSKRRWYEACDACILPSFSEGLPMVVLEAWSYGKPVLMTPQCNLPEGFSGGAAIRIEPSVESISNGLAVLRRHSAQKLTEMGQRGKNLVSDRFTWSTVASDLLAVSRWLVDGDTMPECVMLD